VQQYNDNALIRKATLHVVGDPNGYISTGAQYAFRTQLSGFNPVTGVVSPFGNSVTGSNIQLTVSSDMSAAALQALNGKKGAVSVYNYKTGEVKVGKTQRDTLVGYIQDKIRLSDKFEITPAVRMSHYGNYSAHIYKRDWSNGTIYPVDYDDTGRRTQFTPSLSMQYLFTPRLAGYFSWTNIYRPIKQQDLFEADILDDKPLKDEKGNVYTIGLRSRIGSNTTLGIHYAITKMSNSVTKYSVYSKKKSDYVTKAINAREDKKSFNVVLNHKLGDHWFLGASYTYLYDKFKGKDGVILDPDISWDGNQSANIDAMINHLRPINYYAMNVTYQCGKWNSSLLLNLFSGCDKDAFTNNNYIVADLSVNYKINTNKSVYLKVNNLTNEGYENMYYKYDGKGAKPQPGRSFMLGFRYGF